MNRVNFSDALPQLSKCHLLPDMALTTRSQCQESALAELHGKDHEQKKKFPHVYENGGSCLVSQAQHRPVEMFSCFLFPLCLDPISNMPSSPCALWWGWRHQTHADERLKEDNGAGKGVLWAFPATLLPHSAIFQCFASSWPHQSLPALDCGGNSVRRGAEGFGEHPPSQPGSQPLFKARTCLKGHQSQMWIIDGIRSSLKNHQNPLALSDDQLPKNPSYQNHREHMDFQP